MIDVGTALVKSEIGGEIFQAMTEVEEVFVLMMAETFDGLCLTAEKQLIDGVL